MKEFFTSMDTSQQVYWYIAIGATIIFIIQTIMTFVGADTDTGMDADFDGNLDGGDSPFQLFSFRNLINFLLGFGWAGASLYTAIENQIILGIVAFLIGCLFIVIFFLVMKSLMKLSEDNSFKIEDCVGKIADVYTTIPAAKSGKGRVLISIKGTTHELPAITANTESIRNGTLVKVAEVEGDLLIVVPVK